MQQHQGVTSSIGGGGNIKNVDNVILNTGSTNLNSSIKKVTGGSGKASGIRTSTGRSQGGIPGATDTKGSNSSHQVINRKSNTGGGSQSTRKQQATTNYINKNNLIEAAGVGSASVNQHRIKASAAITQNSNHLPNDDGHMHH